MERPRNTGLETNTKQIRPTQQNYTNQKTTKPNTYSKAKDTIVHTQQQSQIKILTNSTFTNGDKYANASKYISNNDRQVLNAKPTLLNTLPPTHNSSIVPSSSHASPYSYSSASTSSPETITAAPFLSSNTSSTAQIYPQLDKYLHDY